MTIVASQTTNGWQYPAGNNPARLGSGALGDFTIVCWFRPSVIPTNNAAINAVNNCFFQRINSSGIYDCRVGQTGTITRAVTTALTANKWALLAMVWNNATTTLSAYCRQEDWSASEFASSSGSPTFGSATGSTWRCGVFSTFDGAEGVHALTAVRNHVSTQAELDAIWARRDMFDLYDYSPGSGNWNGAAGCLRLHGHGCVYSVGSAAVGKALSTTQAIFDPASSASLIQGVTVTGIAGTVTWADAHAAYAGFFARRVPGTGSGFSPIGAGTRTVLREITTHATAAHRRVLILANSRGAVDSAMDDDLDLSTARRMPGNYAGGWISGRRSRCSGRLNKRPYTSANGQDFGISYDTAPYLTGSPFTLSSATDGYRNFCRAWTGSHGTSDDQGPGNGVMIPGTQSYCARVRDEPGSLLSKDHGLHVECYVRKYPGSCDVTWVGSKSTANNLAGTDMGPATGPIALDTAIGSTVTVGTSPTQRQLTFSDASATIHDAIVIGTGSTGMYAVVSDGFDATVRGVSRIVSKSHSVGTTTINLEHDIRDTITDGSDKLRIGPMSIEVIEADLAATPSGETLRGVKLTAGSAGLGVILHAQSAWSTRTDAYGEVVGTGGWSSHGYAEQLDVPSDSDGEAFPIFDWVDALDADLIIVAGAQQNPTTASNAGQMITKIRARKPSQEIHLAYETRHDTEDFTSDTDTGWLDWIEANAAGLGVSAVQVFEDTGLAGGVLLEQYAAGHRDDGAHYQVRGNRLIVERWLGLYSTVSSATVGKRSRERGRSR